MLFSYVNLCCTLKWNTFKLSLVECITHFKCGFSNVLYRIVSYCIVLYCIVSVLLCVFLMNVKTQ